MPMKRRNYFVLYKVTNIYFSDLILEARETDLSVGDVPDSEVFKYDERDIVRIRAEYDRDANFENPISILEYEE